MEAVKDIHEMYFVRRDIKGSNFAIGRSESTQKMLRILDFELIHHYCRHDVIRPVRSNPGFRGNLN